LIQVVSFLVHFFVLVAVVLFFVLVGFLGSARVFVCQVFLGYSLAHAW